MKSKIFYLLISFCIALAGMPKVEAKTADQNVTMICKNFRQEYQVEYQPERKRLIVKGSGTNAIYSVKTIDKNNDRLIVSGNTVEGGPSYKASMSGDKFIAYYTDGQVDQRDNCK